MAEPIEFDPGRRNIQLELYQQLQAAPEQHVEAMLDVFAIAQLLRDKGIFELIKDTLGSGEKVLGILTEAMETDEVVRTIRNLVIVIKIIGSIEPDTLDKIIRSLSNELETAKSKKPAGFLRLLGQLSNTDSRRAIEPVVTALQAAGRSIPKKSGKERSKVARHKA